MMEAVDSGAWGKEFLRPAMSWLPDWVRAEYLDFLEETLAPDGFPRDDADIPVEGRLAFYESILENRTSAPVWNTLEDYRWLWEANVCQSLPDWPDEPGVNQVADVLQAAHMAYRGFTPLEAMTRRERHELGWAVAKSAQDLAAGLDKLWQASSPDEREYPFPVSIEHDELQELLARISEGATSWMKTPPLLQRPGGGNAARRFFIVSMADWFQNIYAAEMEDGTHLEKRFDNVTTALVNCLYPDGVIDQSTVAKVILGAKGEKSGA